MQDRLAIPWTRRRRHYDVIVVGSGYGGGVAASHLARAGKDVAVIERGREVVTGEFPTRFSDLNAQLRIASGAKSKGAPTALFDVRLGQDMNVVVGCGLGGGSLINGGVALRPDPRVFQDPIWPTPVRNDDRLSIGFDRAEAWLRPARHHQASATPKYQVLKSAADQLGHRVIDTPVAVSFDQTVNLAGVAQPACTLCGDCCAGCNVGAKNTVAMTYLPDAVRHGADVFTEREVHHIEKQRDGTWTVVVHPTGAEPGDDLFDRLTANTVVLAAGTLGSSEILFRSAARGLACSDALGQKFSANGDIIAFGYGAKTPVHAIGVGHPAKVEDISVGAVVSGHIEVRDLDHLDNGLCIEEGVIPSALAPLLPVLFVPDGRLLGALKSLIKGVYKGPFANLQTFFAVSHDSAGGQLSLIDNHITLSWPGAQDEPVYKRLDSLLSDIVANAGGSYVKNPLANLGAGNAPATAHPLGGCAMAEEASSGVVNHKGAVFDTAGTAATTNTHRGLYVVDGSIVPRSLGVNPLLTITALAERALTYLVEEI